MKRSAIATALGVCSTLAIGFAAAPAAAETVDLGTTTDIDLVDIENGVDIEIEQDWTIGDLRPSSDTIPYRPAGSLWEATATVGLPHGGVPMVSGFFARGGDDAYPVLWNVPSPLGISPAALPPDGSATGKLYFDVTGAVPTSIAHPDADDELIIWQTPTH